jgi:hypothetical protein
MFTLVLKKIFWLVKKKLKYVNIHLRRQVREKIVGQMFVKAWVLENK